jgi:putative DNA methylase
MVGRNGKSKAEWVAEEVAKAVNAGKPVAMETVDFSDPNRPPTCLEVDFPILPINQVAAIEGNAGKPIYQMSKWWARRRSSVFRSMLIAAATKAPADRGEAARLVWSNYYCNHQKKGAFKDLKVADIFMGGGTTIVEGARLGMQMYGVDLNPVAWFVVKNEMAKVDRTEVQNLLNAIEADVKPKIMPFYACDCPAGHKGTWTQVKAGEVMPASFDPLSIPREKRHEYRYEGPEIIYVFWAKHGPCSVTGCGHRTPIMSSPVIAIKTLTVKAWTRRCGECREEYDVEDREARMAPGAALVVAESERPYAVAVMDMGGQVPASVKCPHCGKTEKLGKLGKGKNKKVEFTLLIHPAWLKGVAGTSKDGKVLGGSMSDGPEETMAWNRARAKKCQFVEVRGTLPPEVICPDTGVTLKTGEDGGTVPKRSNFACGSCGNVQDVLTSVKGSGKTGPVAAYAIQGYCPECDRKGEAYGGRFFAPVNETVGYDAGVQEWEVLKEGVLADFWPRSELPYGFMTHKLNGGIPNHGFTHWWKMFNPRQRIVQAELLRAIVHAGNADWSVREFVLGAFQQYLRNQNMFCFWNEGADKLEPMMSNANFHPKSTVIENCVFACLGRGNWVGSSSCLEETALWEANPWDTISNDILAAINPDFAEMTTGKSEKVFVGDPVVRGAVVDTGSATELPQKLTGTHDLVITDPPFGGLLHYSELSDFFYVWLRLVLKDRYPAEYGPEYTPKTLEVVANRARQPDDPDGYYQRLLTASWVEAGRILKSGGMLAFTFHHSEDAPWVQVLESLFDAGFYLEATYPIRGDETKGAGQFGSRKVEYDIIHVCRKRTEEPTPVSWAKMRREVIRDVRQIQELLEAHAAEGLPEADVQVIRRGKALEYFSKHYGKVYVDEGKPITVLEALAGVNQLLDEESGGTKDPPPVTAEPFTRQFLRLFDGIDSMDRNDLQKYLRGTGINPSEFETRGWCQELDKAFHVTPLLDIARGWIGKKRAKFTNDYEQAAFMMGACMEGSGINPRETLNNPNFRPHPALNALLEWFATRATTQEVKNAARRAQVLYKDWVRQHAEEAKQMELFFNEEET